MLVVLLRDPQVERRWWAVRALSEIPGEASVTALLDALADPDPAVRQCAALGLRGCPDPRSIPFLIKSLHDPDPLAAQLAGQALVAIGPAAVEPLLASLEEGPPPARLLAVRSLAELRDPRAVSAFFQALDDDSMLVEYWANEGLERLGIGMTFFSP